MALAGAEEMILTLPGDLPRQVMNEFIRGWKIREVMAEVEQQQAAAARPEATWCDGLGQHMLSIQPDAFHYWGQRLGYKCWADKQFRREYARDNPSSRVVSRARKTVVRVDGLKKKV